MRTLIAALLASTALSLSPASAQLMAPLGVASGGGYSPPAAPVKCPYTGYPADGCSGAPAWSSVQNPGFFTGVGGTRAAQSGQPAYTIRPPWNVAGVDYAIGAAPTASLADPATATLPSGCSYHAQASPGVSYITCSVAGNLILSGLNMSAIGGHACTMIDLWDSTVGGTIATIQNDYFQYNITNCGYQAICKNPACSPINGGSNGSDGNFVTWIIGNTIDWTAPQYTVPGTGYSNPSINFQSVYDNYVEYNYFLNPQRTIASMGPPNSATTSGSMIRRYNYVWGFDYSADGSHVEWENVSKISGASNVAMGTWNMDFNAIQVAKNHGPAWAGIFGDVLQPPDYGTYTSVTINNNTIVTNTSTVDTISNLMLIGQAQYGSLQIKDNYLDKYTGGNNIYCSNGPNHHAPGSGSVLPITAAYPTISGNTDLITGNVNQYDQIVSLYYCQNYGVQLVGTAQAAGNGTAVSAIPISYAPVAGDLVCIVSLNLGATQPTITDNKGGTYPIAQNTTTPNSEGYYAYMGCKTSVASGVTTITVSFSSPNTWSNQFVYEVSGATGIDGGNAAVTTLGSAGKFSSGTWTTTQGQMLLGYVHSNGTLDFTNYNWTVPGTGGSNDKQLIANVSPQSISIYANAPGGTSNIAIGVAVY